MPTRYILGLGTGRCGTASLAALLDAQDGATVTHEEAPPIPWEPSGEEVGRAVRWLKAQDGRLVGDVAHSWIGLLPHIAGRSVRCIGLWRPVEDTVQSFLRHMPADYIQTDGPKGAKQFPTYDLPAEEGWTRYVETYQLRLKALALNGVVSLYPIDALNSEVGQKAILGSARVPEGEHVYLNNCHHNATA